MDDQTRHELKVFVIIQLTVLVLVAIILAGCARYKTEYTPLEPTLTLPKEITEDGKTTINDK